MIHRACGHDEVSDDGTQSNLPILKCFSKGHWSFEQIFIKWLNGQSTGKDLLRVFDSAFNKLVV